MTPNQTPWLLEGTDKTSVHTGSQGKGQWPHRMLSQTRLWVFEGLLRRRGLPAVGTVVLAAAVLGGMCCISPMKVAMSNTTEPAYRGAGKGVSTLSESSVQGFKTGNSHFSLTSHLYSCWASQTQALSICKDVRAYKSLVSMVDN